MTAKRRKPAGPSESESAGTSTGTRAHWQQSGPAPALTMALPPGWHRRQRESGVAALNADVLLILLTVAECEHADAAAQADKWDRICASPEIAAGTPEGDYALTMRQHCGGRAAAWADVRDTLSGGRYPVTMVLAAHERALASFQSHAMRRRNGEDQATQS